MKYAHNLQLRVFCKKEDDREKIKERIHELADFDFEKEKIEYKEESVELFDGSTMKIITLFLKKQRHTTRFLKNLFSKLNEEQKELLENQLESRLDKNLHFFLRLDKDKLLKEDNYWICDSGNCFHLDICIAAYPHKREAAREIVKKVLMDF
ncbi:hypothetical protein GF327_03500 [Candidatus Woesearchaeota archaeon]|nr:hypothetical protein [Candidatus Woesearchaeota archaeon]